MALPEEVKKVLGGWAGTGDRTDPDDATLSPTLTRATGWPASFSATDGDTPRRRVMNQLFHELFALARYVLQRGVVEYDDEVDYPVNAVVQASDGNLYKADTANGPSSTVDDPVSGSEWSRVNTARSTTAPAAPNAPTATAGNGRLEWSWNCPLDNGSVITGFRFQQRVSGGAWPATEMDVTPPHTTGTGLVNGQTYEARVKAVNAEGESPWSMVGSAVPVASAPDRVQQLIAEPSDQAINLRWSTPEDNGATITTFHIQWKSGVENWATTRQISDAASPGTIPNLTNGTTYDVRVRAVNSAGVGDWSSVISTTPGASDHYVTTAGTTTFTWPWATTRARVVCYGGGGGGASSLGNVRGTAGGESSVGHGVQSVSAPGGPGGSGNASSNQAHGNGGDGGVGAPMGAPGGPGTITVGLLTGLSPGDELDVVVGAGGPGGSGGGNAGSPGGAGSVLIVPLS